MDHITVNARKSIKFVPVRWDEEHHVNLEVRKEWPAGESAAKERLGGFLKKAIKEYDENRDKPAILTPAHVYLHIKQLVPFPSRNAIARLLP